jgi:hypothetical protein
MKVNEIITEAANPAQQAAIAISMKKAGKKPRSQVNELAPDSGGGGSGNYFQALASAWYNGTFDSASLQKGIKSQQDVERLLQRGVIAPDGKTRKYNIDYNSDFDGVVIFSDDYYEHGDHDDTDSRTGKPFGPYDYMEFSDDELSEGIFESAELEEEFDLIESIIERLAEHNGVDAEVIWEDLETLTEDELYAFAVTSEPIMESTRKGEYGRVLDALGLYYPRISMEELNTPGYYKVIANKADVPVEYAAQVIDGFVNDDRYYDDEEQGVAEGELDEAHHGSLLDHNKGQFASVIFQSQWDTDPQIDYYNNLDDAKFDTENASAHHGSVYAWNGARWVRKMSATERNGSGGGYGSWAENKQGVAEDWQKANKRDRTDGMSQKAVNAYRRENPGSKLKTAVTTKPSKLKKGGKASKRRKSYCSRSRGQMKMHSISCAKTPDKAICKARRRWNC